MEYPFDVKSELSNVDFVIKTQQQIIKDFGSVDIDFPDNFRTIPLHFDQLIIEISTRLKDLHSSGSTSFSQLLYQVDLPESILSDLSQSDDYYSSLAEIVLKREAYKVFLRRKFSS